MPICPHRASRQFSFTSKKPNKFVARHYRHKLPAVGCTFAIGTVHQGKRIIGQVPRHGNRSAFSLVEVPPHLLTGISWLATVRPCRARC
jgi:hypothetical protein